MSPFITSYVELLEEQCARGVRDQNDLISLVCTGEELRRALVAEQARDERAEAAMAEYAYCLRCSYRLAPAGLEGDLYEALCALEDHEPPRDEAAFIEAEDVVAGIDEVLMVAAACVRIGALDRQDAADLAMTAVEHAADCGARLAWAAPLAAARADAFGPDPSLPLMYSWLGVVARA